MSDDEAEMAQLRQNRRFQDSAASKLSEARRIGQQNTQYEEVPQTDIV